MEKFISVFFLPSNYVLKPSEGNYSQTSIFTSFFKLNKPKFHEEGKNIFMQNIDFLWVILGRFCHFIKQVNMHLLV